MTLLVAYRRGDEATAQIVAAALGRSFSASQVALARYEDISAWPEGCILLHPDEIDADLLASLCSAGRKVLLLGTLGDRLRDSLGLVSRPPELAASAAQAPPWGDSPLRIRYSDAHELARASGLRSRALCRFDFNDEWNNLGFGRITLGGGPWSLADASLHGGTEPLAWLEGPEGNKHAAYAVLRDLPQAALLWFNRAVGPVDSLEWPVVEAFFGDHRADELACLPYLGEVPAGYQVGVTMRLDADEAIASARPLFEAYADRGRPFSLAVKTSLPVQRADFRLLEDVLAAGGSVVSHSEQHAPAWGGSYAAARRDAESSRIWLEDHVPTARPVRFAVSPFHQNPSFAVRALADSGYDGFVGGIIHNDPECLLGRAGRVPGHSRIVAHSQQCMLHGDCPRPEVHVESFHNHLRARALFGFLDHPFSERYQYGWQSEQQRCAAHARLWDAIERVDGVWRPSLGECLAFIQQRAQTCLSVNDGRVVIAGPYTALPLAVCWKGERHAA